MSQAIRIDGKALAAERRERLAREVATLQEHAGRAPALTVVVVGEDPASQVYVRNKHRACEKAGITSEVRRLDASTSSEELRAVVDEINADDGVDGLLVQLPVPEAIDPADVREWISPEKDVDGLHPRNVGLLASGTPGLVPCTPLGCLHMLEHYDIPIAGRRAVVLGRSLIVGRPMAALLSRKGTDATVTIAHSRSHDLPSLCREAEILIAAAGVPELVQADWVRPGAAVLDVGIHRIEDPSHPKGARLVGDVHRDVAEVAGHLSPVPGGVGPMTIAMLLENTVTAFRGRMRLETEGAAS
jgi:methylenetetrahydrofolate dehydrogenase (NADP+)/methenyltetrahydrofolate cyclohydrolase